MTALRSIQTARSMLDDIASTQPLTNAEAIELANAYARLADAEARLQQAAAAGLHAKSVDAIATVQEQSATRLSKALESVVRGVDTYERLLRAPRPHAAPPSSSPRPGVRL